MLTASKQKETTQPINTASTCCCRHHFFFSKVFVVFSEISTYHRLLLFVESHHLTEFSLISRNCFCLFATQARPLLLVLFLLVGLLVLSASRQWRFLSLVWRNLQVVNTGVIIPVVWFHPLCKSKLVLFLSDLALSASRHSYFVSLVCYCCGLQVI